MEFSVENDFRKLVIPCPMTHPPKVLPKIHPLSSSLCVLVSVPNMGSCFLSHFAVVPLNTHTHKHTPAEAKS